MGFLDRAAGFLKLKSGDNKLREELSATKEQLVVAKRILDEKDDAKSITELSAIAKEEKTIEDPQGLKLRRVPVKQLQHLYISNQFIFRGVNVRADEVISRGYELIRGDELGKVACQELIDRSGGDNLFWQFSVNTDVCGDGYLEKVFTKDGKKIAYLKHINPVNFGFLTDESDRIILDANNLPKAYEQTYYDKDGVEQTIEVPKDRIVHLRFNCFADEFNGISTLQPVYNTAVRLMNMENAAAEAAVKTANPLLVGKTETKSLRELAAWSQVLNNISAKDQVFLPQGVDLKMLSPGYQNFSYYSSYFLDAVVAALGVPKSILTGSSDMTGGNRSTVTVQSRHFFSVIRANQRYIEEVINQVFKQYGEMAGFEPPLFKFADVAEDADVTGQRAMELYGAGIITLEESRRMIGLETQQAVEMELKSQNEEKVTGEEAPAEIAQGGDEAALKKSDMEAWHPAEPGSPAGSQKGAKRKQRVNPEVKSVRASPFPK